MKQKLSKLIISSLIILFSFNSPAIGTVFPGLKKILDRGEIIISFTPNSTAMFTEVDDQKNITGIDVEVARLIAKELGVKLKIIKSAPDWNGIVEEVAANKADLGISFLSITTERSKKILYSIPYVQIRQALLFNNLSTAIQRKNGVNVIKDMFTNKESMVIGVFAGSSYVDFANNMFPGVKIKQYETTEELIKSTLKRDIDAVLVDELELFAALRKDPGLKVKLTEIILKDQPDLISVAVDPTNRDLLEFINNVLRVRQVNYTVNSAYLHTLEQQKLKALNDKK